MKEQEQWQVSESAAGKYELFVASWFGSWSADLVERAELKEGVGMPWMAPPSSGAKPMPKPATAVAETRRVLTQVAWPP